MIKRSKEELLDRRIVERSIHRGLVTRADYDEFVAELPDEAEHAVECETTFVHTVRDEAEAQAEA